MQLFQRQITLTLTEVDLTMELTRVESELREANNSLLAADLELKEGKIISLC